MWIEVKILLICVHKLFFVCKNSVPSCLKVAPKLWLQDCRKIIFCMAKCQTLEIFEVKNKSYFVRSNNIVQIRFKEHRCPILHWVASVSPLYHTDILLLIIMMMSSGPGHDAWADVGHHSGDDAEESDEKEDAENDVVKQNQQLGQTHLEWFKVSGELVLESKILFPRVEICFRLKTAEPLML